MARSSSKSKNDKGKKRATATSPDPDLDLDRAVAKALEMTRKRKMTKPKKKKKKVASAPAPRPQQSSSEEESSSEPSSEEESSEEEESSSEESSKGLEDEDEVSRLRAEIAALRAERDQASRDNGHTLPPHPSGSGPQAAATERIKIPDKKEKINARKWRELLGWGDDKAPWLQCRAYTRRAVTHAPLDLSKPWKQQEPADVGSAVALLTQRVPSLSRFEKNWGALQLVQETFNHMRGTFVVNELTEDEKEKKQQEKEERKRKKEQEQADEDRGVPGRRPLADNDETAESEQHADNQGAPASRLTNVGQRSPPNSTPTSRRTSLAPGSRPASSASPTNPLGPQDGRNSSPHASSTPRPDNDGRGVGNTVTANDPPGGNNTVTADNPPVSGMGSRSTTDAAALAALNGGVPVSAKSKGRPGKKSGAGASETSTTAASKKKAGGEGGGSGDGIDGIEASRGQANEHAGQDHTVKPKSPQLPAREVLPRKSKTHAKEMSSSMAPKPRKRKGVDTTEQGGSKKRAKKA